MSKKMAHVKIMMVGNRNPLNKCITFKSGFTFKFFSSDIYISYVNCMLLASAFSSAPCHII